MAPVAGAHLAVTKPKALKGIKSKLWQGEFKVSNASCKPVWKSRAGRIGTKPAFRHYSCVVRVEVNGAKDPLNRWKFRYHATGRRVGQWRATNVRKQCREANRWRTVRKIEVCLPPHGGAGDDGAN